jgi:hypothetical protein
MPMHDWTRVPIGVFHDFHNAWVTHLSESFNIQFLPKEFYSLGERPCDELSSAIEDAAFYQQRRRSVSVREDTGDRVVALVEIVSPANKHTRNAVDDFVDKVMSALNEGIHVLVIDPFPPGKYDPQGLHAALWQELGESIVELPADRRLELVSYCAKAQIKAYIEPMRVGLPLADMPLFLRKTHYIHVPLETTYMQAWAGVPERWRRVVDA